MAKDARSMLLGYEVTNGIADKVIRPEWCLLYGNEVR